MSSFKVGQKVRVNTDNSTRVAIISFVNESDGTYDVIYDNNAEEAANLSKTKVSRLESFEYDEMSTDPPTLKEHGNVLFSKYDYISAHSYYTNSLSLLTKQSPIEIGSNIIIQRNKTSTDYSIGMISDIYGSLADILYDNTSDINGEEEDLGVDISQVTVIVPKFEELQRSLYLNLCRCCMKQGLYGWAVTWSSRAIALSKHLIQQHIPSTDTNSLNNTTPNKLNKQLSDGYYLRASLLLSAHRPYLARRDVIHLLSLQPTSVQPADLRAAQLTRDIDRFLYNRKISNKKLAKQVAQWVDQAMNTNQQLAHEGSNDICIAADDECTDEAEVRPTTDNITPSPIASPQPSSAHIQSNNTSANTIESDESKTTQPVMTLSSAVSFIVMCLAVVLLLFGKLLI